MLGIGRKAFLPLALAAGVGGPYLYSSSGELVDKATSALPSWKSSNTQSWTDDSETAMQETIIVQPDLGAPILQPMEKAIGQPVVVLEEAFRMDLTSGWVLSRWPRVSTQLSSIEYNGLRVPLVSGSTTSDVAGALTYYFDEKDVLQQLSFRGSTGDPSRLIYWLQSNYDFRPQQASPGEKRYVVRWNGEEISELEIHPAAIMDSDQPFSRYDVYLTMRRKKSVF